MDSHYRRPGTVASWLRDAEFRLDAELVIAPDEEVPGAVLLAHGE